MELKTGKQLLAEYNRQENVVGKFVPLEGMIDQELKKAKSFPLDAVVILQPLKEEILQILGDCSLKLQLYRGNATGEYQGGVEYSRLQGRISSLYERLSE